MRWQGLVGWQGEVGEWLVGKGSRRVEDLGVAGLLGRVGWQGRLESGWVVDR